MNLPMFSWWAWRKASSPAPSRYMREKAKSREERRLAYVAITRAKRKLYLTNSFSRMLFGMTNRNSPSRFLNEIPESLTNRTAASSPLRGEGVFRRRIFPKGRPLGIRLDGILPAPPSAEDMSIGKTLPSALKRPRRAGWISPWATGFLTRPSAADLWWTPPRRRRRAADHRL